MRQRLIDLKLQPGDMVTFYPGSAHWRSGVNNSWESVPLIFIGIGGSDRQVYGFFHWSGSVYMLPDGLWDCEVLSRVEEALG